MQPLTTTQKWWIAFGVASLAVVAGAWWSRYRKTPRLIMGRPPEAPAIDGYSDGDMKTTLRVSDSMSIEERLASIQKLVYKSVQDPQMRKIALEVTRHCAERDGTCEAQAVYKFVKDNVRYTGDVAPIAFPDGTVDGIDLYQSARRTLEMGGGDCLPAGTLLLVDGHRFVKIEDLIIGQRIWGRDDWTTVKDVWFKGVLPVDAVHLNNGSSFMATGDHKVYVAICHRHTGRVNSPPCHCPIEERTIERIKVSQLEPDMVLVQPDRIAFGTEKMDPRQAYVEGLYVSDGYQSHDSDFDISGRDGHPKEAQKREVLAICNELGFETTWFEKSIRVRDKEWAQRVAKMGTRAINKHALSISLERDAATELLRGIMADSGKNTRGSGRTFTTTSRELLLQTRILHRMLGTSCSERYIVDHGGEGEHPIWRLGVRYSDRERTNAIKLLRVKEIDRDVTERPVYDLATEDHYVYLPEADVTVSNCDDQSILVATLLSLNGITPRLRVIKERKRDDWSHIYPTAGLSKNEPTRWIPVDTTLPGDDNFGVEGHYADAIDFPA